MLSQQDKQYIEDKFLTRDEFHSFKDEILTRFDKIMFELKAIREEQIVGSYRRIENFDLLENHESRITILEKKEIIN